MHYELTYTNERDESIVFGTDEIKVNVLEGFGDVNADVQMQKAPYMDGSTNIDTILEERHIYIEFTLRGRDYGDLSSLRRNMSRVFNPKLRGKFTISFSNKTYEIEGWSDNVPFFPDKGTDAIGKVQVGSIDWTAPDPYWRDPNQTAKALQSYVGNFKLPMTFPFELGVAGSRTTLYNEGDIPAPVTIDIHGPTTNPQVINRTTGDYIRINRSIADDEILHINTASGEQQIEIYRGNSIEQGFGYLDHNSELFMLEMGENEIEHIADAGDRNAIVAVTWQSRFVGI